MSSLSRGKRMYELALEKIKNEEKHRIQKKESKKDTEGTKYSEQTLQNEKATPSLELNLDEIGLTVNHGIIEEQDVIGLQIRPSTDNTCLPSQSYENLPCESKKDTADKLGLMENEDTKDSEQTLQNEKATPSLELNLDQIGLTVNHGIIEEQVIQISTDNTCQRYENAPDENMPCVSTATNFNGSLEFDYYNSVVSERDPIEGDLRDGLLLIAQFEVDGEINRPIDNFVLENIENYDHTEDMDLGDSEIRPRPIDLLANNNSMQKDLTGNDEHVMEVSVENEELNNEGMVNHHNNTPENGNENPESHVLEVTSEVIEFNGRPKKGRKQKHVGQTRKLRKERKNSNEPYFSSRGKEVEPKEFKIYSCLCKNKCHEQVSVEIREREFKKFWELGSYNAQTAYIGALVSEKPVKRHYTKDDGNQKQFSRIYTINKIVVCRDMFIYTFGLSPKRISNALAKIRSNSIIDKRGISGGHNKISDAQFQEVLNHIKSIPKYKSHYVREKTDREYLPSHMTLQIMYDLYKIDCATEPVSISKYREIFYSKFNLRRKRYQKDTCNLCDSLQVKISNEKRAEVKAELETQKEDHMTAQENARQALNDDMKLATQNAHVETLTFDLEKTISLPKIPSNIVYYKRQLSVYNLGIHSAKLNQSYCFVWMESEAGRGAQEIGSCIKKYFSKYIDTNITHVNLWSDSCGGQNRNIKIVMMLQHLLYSYPNLESISLKFLVSGHSYLPNDTDFSFIETALKQQVRLYTVSDFICVIKSCKKKKPLTVERMEKSEFFSTLSLEKSITNRKQDVEKIKINWFQWREITIHKNMPFVLNFKTRQGPLTPFNQLDIKKKSQGRPLTEEQIFAKDLEKLWPTGKPISVPKLKDIKSMMHLIPSEAKQFYKDLFSSPRVEDDIEGYNIEELDFEVEFDGDVNYVVDD